MAKKYIVYNKGNSGVSTSPDIIFANSYMEAKKKYVNRNGGNVKSLTATRNMNIMD